MEIASNDSSGADSPSTPGLEPDEPDQPLGHTQCESDPPEEKLAPLEHAPSFLTTEKDNLPKPPPMLEMQPSIFDAWLRLQRSQAIKPFELPGLKPPSAPWMDTQRFFSASVCRPSSCRGHPAVHQCTCT